MSGTEKIIMKANKLIKSVVELPIYNNTFGRNFVAVCSIQLNLMFNLIVSEFA